MTQLELLSYSCRSCKSAFLSYTKVFANLWHWSKSLEDGSWQKVTDQLLRTPDKLDVTDNSYLNPIANERLCRKCYEIAKMKPLTDWLEIVD